MGSVELPAIALIGLLVVAVTIAAAVVWAGEVRFDCMICNEHRVSA